MQGFYHRMLYFAYLTSDNTVFVDYFSEEEKHILKSHFSNTDKTIFAIITPRQVDRGALMSRYSRTDKTMRRIFLDEFANNPSRGEEFYGKVLSEYGDDSVAELGEAQVALESASNIAVKQIEDHRIGLSYLEKSSRYIAFDKKINGQYKYHKEEAIMTSSHADLYIQACDHAFDIYGKNIETMQKYISEITPIDCLFFFDSSSKQDIPYGNLKVDRDIETARRIYKATIKAKTLDILRALLPSSTLTNLGITGNGRAFEYLLSTMFASNLNEVKCLAEQLHTELNIIIPAFVKRANDNKYGKSIQSYLINTRNAIYELGQEYLKSIKVDPNPVEAVKLLDFQDNFEVEVKIASAILYEQARGQSLESIMRYLRSIPEEERNKIIRTYTKFRSNRRHRPGRAFEMAEYTFEMFTNFGMFRDLHRHRILTIERQLLSTRHGYDIPAEIIDFGIVKDFKDCMYKCHEAYEIISKQMPEEAQYVVNFAYRYPYFMKINLREACHMIELRTIPQGHPDYRKVCQRMFSQIKFVHPALAKGIKFVDLNRYELERLNAEKDREKKRLN